VKQRVNVSERAARTEWGKGVPASERVGGAAGAKPPGSSLNYARDPKTVGRQIAEAYTFSQRSLSPVALLLTRDLMEE